MGCKGVICLILYVCSTSSSVGTVLLIAVSSSKRRKVRIGETGRGMHELIEEHGRDIRDIRLSRTQTSTVSEHTNKIGHHPPWNGVRVSDRDLNWYSRRVKELSYAIKTSRKIKKVELKFLKRGCLRTDSATAERHWTAKGNFFPYASDRTYQT